MYVTVDMDRLAFLHKHHDHQTASGLSWLECGQGTSVRVENIEADNFLRGITHGDLLRLYKNVTAQEPLEQSWGDRAFHFREHLREVARHLPVTTALAEEVEAQVDAVADRLHAGETFRYALGARTPAQPAELFPIPPRPLTPAQMKTADERGARRQREFRDELDAERRGDGLPSRPWEAAKVPPPPPPTGDTGTAEDAGAARRAKAAPGSVRPVIRGRADVAWSARGTKDWKTVRAELIEALSLEGYHPTTIRIKLAEWARDNGVS
jgi:hypothetical protein